MRRDALVTVKLTADEARSLEVELDSLVRKLRERTAIAPSTAADDIIARFAAISAKVRVARNPVPARGGVISKENAPKVSEHA